MKAPRYEYAILEDVFRGVHVHKGGLRSEEEARLWLTALRVTIKRQDTEHFYKTDGLVARGELWVGRREILGWEPVPSAEASA